MRGQLEDLNRKLKELDLEQSIAFVLERIAGKKVFSTSFGIEDQVLTHFLQKYANTITVFTLDTGRQFDETYEVFHKTQKKYPALTIETYTPEEKEIKKYINEYGINGFYDSIENRKACCAIRKVAPLSRALEGADLWITGLRSEQSANRESMAFLEWDEVNQLVKFNPLLAYSLPEIEALITSFSIPINNLYKKGFLSIGCAPCTRALLPGEDFRAGRWWWENGKKECGLHIHSDKNN